MTISLQNKNILVTGASSGIGAECCKCCSEAGANLILNGRNKEKLDKTFSMLSPGNHAIVHFDLNDIDGIEKSFTQVFDLYGKIHGFIHSAGIDISKPLNSLRYKDYFLILNSNLISGFELARILSKKQFCPENGASYVFIASVMGSVGEAGRILYSSSKGALLSGCRSMAIELAARKIRINCVSPAIVRTKMVDMLFNDFSEENIKRIESLHPLGFGIPADIANACNYLLSDKARWITGSNFVVDGGYSAR